MVEQIKKFNFIKPNDKQKTYAAIIFAVTGGTLMYTAWQFIVPTELDMPPINPFALVFLVLISLIFIRVGYNVYSKERK